MSAKNLFVMRREENCLVLIINSRQTGAARTSQKDLTKFQTFCRSVSRNMKDSAVVSMKYAGEEAVDCSRRGTGRLMYVDGTWQCSGYVSLNGVVSAVSTDTGKVIDIEVPTKCFQRHAGASVLKPKEYQQSGACNKLSRCQMWHGGSCSNGCIYTFC
jgi:hypothetical protein